MCVRAQASSVYLEKQMIPNLRSLIQKAETAPKAKKGVPVTQPPKARPPPLYFGIRIHKFRVSI